MIVDIDKKKASTLLPINRGIYQLFKQRHEGNEVLLEKYKTINEEATNH